MTREERSARWSAIVERQATSGMRGIAWCRENHINPASFYSWRKKLNEPQLERGFIELNSSIGENTGIRICLGTNLSIEVERGFDPFTLRDVIETLVNNFPCSA